VLEIDRLERELRTTRLGQEQLGVELERVRALEQAVIETASGPIVVLDTLGRMQRVNPLATRLSGYPVDGFVGRPFWGAVPPAEVAAVRATLDAIFADGGSRTDTCHWLTRTGQRRLIRWTFTPLLGREASVAYVVAVGDIADDVARQAAASAAAECMKQVHTLVAKLAAADTLEQVAQTILDEACAALGASAGTLVRCSSDGLRLEAVGAIGYPVGSVESELPVAMLVPLATAVRLGEAVLLPSAEDSLRAGYAQRPDYLLLGHGAWAALPRSAGAPLARSS
jgi:PAS domain S-box-containing protein